jgi:S-methylmethionine-dependent homocysteine/selenocysteine methylase
MILLDGPMGSQLTARGVDTRGAAWSARALVDAPHVVRAIHAEYAAAGATVHRANTFRTRARTVGDAWPELTRHAIALARIALPAGARVAGSLAPIEDCYRPDLSPPADEARADHAAFARVLDGAGVDLIVCETFPHAGEALIAVEAAVATGRETWASLTAGPDGALATPSEIATAARACVAAGARAVLVNCVAADHTLPYVEALARAGAPFGAYANGATWNAPPVDAEAYARLARAWIAAGATIVGGCCGTGAAHIRALAALRAS